MNLSKIFQLTEEDKSHYNSLIEKIDLSTSDSIIAKLAPKIDSLISAGSLNSIELDLIENVSALVAIYKTYPDLSKKVRRSILFAVSYFCDENDDIPDIVPVIGYLDDAVVAKWVIDSISNELPDVSLA